MYFKSHVSYHCKITKVEDAFLLIVFFRYITKSRICGMLTDLKTIYCRLLEKKEQCKCIQTAQKFSKAPLVFVFYVSTHSVGHVEH